MAKITVRTVQGDTINLSTSYFALEYKENEEISSSGNTQRLNRYIRDTSATMTGGEDAAPCLEGYTEEGHYVIIRGDQIASVTISD